jgi:hypothetical protein
VLSSYQVIIKEEIIISEMITASQDKETNAKFLQLIGLVPV